MWHRLVTVSCSWSLPAIMRAVMNNFDNINHALIPHHLALVCCIKVHAPRPPIELVVVLHERPQSVRLQLFVSTTQDFNCGVPEGKLQATTPGTPSRLSACTLWVPSPGSCPAVSCRKVSHSGPAPGKSSQDLTSKHTVRDHAVKLAVDTQCPCYSSPAIPGEPSTS